MENFDKTLAYTFFFMIMFFTFNLIAWGNCELALVPFIPAVFMLGGPRLVGTYLFVALGMVAISLQAYYTGYYYDGWLWAGLVFLNLSSLVGHFMKKMDDSKSKFWTIFLKILLFLFALSALGVLTGASGDIDGDNALAVVLLTLLIAFNIALIGWHVSYSKKKQIEFKPVSTEETADAPKPLKASTLRF
tara:strand:+ start:209 stop:778 length:570 start_codon:yes stop_codon:yes gene_type:complete